jgi:hypothetical protein
MVNLSNEAVGHQQKMSLLVVRRCENLDKEPNEAGFAAVSNDPDDSFLSGDYFLNRLWELKTTTYFSHMYST